VPNEIVHALGYAAVGGSGSLVGTVLVLGREAWVRKWSSPMVALAAGAMATTAIAHLFPEALEKDEHGAPLWTLAGFAFFFLMNQVVSFHACGRGLTHLHPIGTVALVGILVHSFFDGVAIGAGFGSTEATGRVVSAAVFAHELPEGAITVIILLHTGMSRARALGWGVVHGVLTPVGAAAALAFGTGIDGDVLGALLGLSAGSFLYVASANLIPEAHKVSSRLNAASFLLGVALILGLTKWTAGALHDHDHEKTTEVSPAEPGPR
jgi:ZIP family zinc transporter/zinc and cadmium transporter